MLACAGGFLVCLLAFRALPHSSAAAAFQTTPSESQPAEPPATAQPQTPGAVTIARDPFVRRLVASPSSRRRPAVGEAPESVPMIPILPPNDVVAAAAVPAGTGRIMLRAVIAGPRALAMLEIDGKAVLVGIGDSLLGTRVASIDLTGIALGDGRRIGFARTVSTPGRHQKG